MSIRSLVPVAFVILGVSGLAAECNSAGAPAGILPDGTMMQDTSSMMDNPGMMGDTTEKGSGMM